MTARKNPNAMTPKRKKACVRDSRGRFKVWKGGLTKADLAKPRNRYHGLRVHIGQQFVEQNGRPATLGDTHLTLTAAGKPHKQATTYVKTQYGWRDTGKRKPTRAEVRRVMQTARPSRTTGRLGR